MPESKLEAPLCISLLLKSAVLTLTEGRIPQPQLEAEILLAHVLNCTGTELIINHDKPVSEADGIVFYELVEKRCFNMPTAYLTGYREFMSLCFKVTPAVLIPRPETELLVEKVLESFNGRTSIRGLDIGTGSGCIPISIVKHFPGKARFVAVDISREALKIAQENSIEHGVAEKIEFSQSNMFSTISPQDSFDVITANLPYISDAEYSRLMGEVRDHEPSSALQGGKDGLDHIRIFVREAQQCMNDSGIFFIEIGYDQGNRARSFIESSGNYSAVQLHKDYNGNDRLITALKKGGSHG